MQAALLSFGDELIRGERVNTHPELIAPLLKEKGFKLDSILTLPDRSPPKEPLQWMLQHHRIVVMTGGLGPTEDDQTRGLIAELYHQPLVLDEQYSHSVEIRYGEGYPSKAVSLIPEKANLLPNSIGSASGFILVDIPPFPNTVLLVLPGPPDELEAMLPLALAHLPMGPDQDLISSHLFLFDVPEHVIDASLEKLDASLSKLSMRKNVQIGLLPSYGFCEVILTSKNPLLIKKVEEHLISSFPKSVLLGPDSISLEQWIVSMLSKKKQRLFVVESCTGGCVSAYLTSIPGASEVYAGGTVVYSNESKISLMHISKELLEEYGPVSKEMAESLARISQEHFQTSFSLAIVGFLGPRGGTEKNPVGTVYLSIASKNVLQTKKVLVRGERKACQKKATLYALSFLAEKLLSE